MFSPSINNVYNSMSTRMKGITDNSARVPINKYELATSLTYLCQVTQMSRDSRVL